MTLEIFQIMEYDRDNGIMRANTALAGEDTHYFFKLRGLVLQVNLTISEVRVQLKEKEL